MYSNVQKRQVTLDLCDTGLGFETGQLLPSLLITCEDSQALTVARGPRYVFIII